MVGHPCDVVLTRLKAVWKKAKGYRSDIYYNDDFVGPGVPMI